MKSEDQKNPKTDKFKAARAYASMWNRLDASEFLPLLAEDVVYTSQNVFSNLDGKSAVANYLAGKIETVKKTPVGIVFAELGKCGWGDCVLIAQGQKEPPIAVVLFKIAGSLIKQIDMCSVAPRVSEVMRSGVYPK